MVSSRPGSCLVAGSYAVEMYLQSTRQSQWQANDIDVFVSSAADVQLVERCYNDIVVRPLHLAVDKLVWRCYADERAAVPPLPEDLDTAALTEQFSLPPQDLRTLISDWLDDYRLRVLSYGDLDGNAEVDEFHSPDGNSSAVLLLRRVLCNLPATFTLPPYNLRETRRLRSQLLSASSAQTMATFLPACLRPINIIFADVTDTACAGSTFSSIIRGGFDISLCSVALMLDDALSMDFEASDETFADIVGRRLRLRGSAFTSRTARVATQMERVTKYIGRGFRW